MKFNLIDIENWSRKTYFEHYLNNVRCTFAPVLMRIMI